LQNRVTVEMSDGVAEVRLVRAAKLNALDADMFEALAAAIDRLMTEPNLRAVILSADGKSFCAGLDMDRMKGNTERDHEPRTHGIANASQYVVWGWRMLPVPVIAAVQGVAYGGGCQLALGPVIRYLSPDARMSIMEIKWGLVPNMAETPIMPGLVCDDLLRELCFTARILSAPEALQVGFATRIYDDPRAAALQTAREIAGRNPEAIRAMKRMFNDMTPDPASALMAESVEQMKLLGSANQREAVMANFEKRKPVFTNSD
jgi:enoyl-CoA hydratase/carnithine racemase